MKIEEAIRQKKFASAKQKAIINIIYTHHWLLEKQHQVFDDFDITHQQFNVLRILRGKYPEATSPGAVKEVMIDKNPDLTRLCDRLVNKALIKREFNSENRRQVVLKITQQGLNLLEEIEPVMQAASKQIKLTEKDATILSDLLDKLRG